MCVCCIVYIIYLLLWVSEYHLVILIKTDSSRKPADCLFVKPSIRNVVRRPGLLTQNSYPPAGSWRLDLVLHTCNYQLCTAHSDWEPGESEFEDNVGYMVNPCLKKIPLSGSAGVIWTRKASLSCWPGSGGQHWSVQGHPGKTWRAQAEITPPDCQSCVPWIWLFGLFESVVVDHYLKIQNLKFCKENHGLLCGRRELRKQGT